MALLPAGEDRGVYFKDLGGEVSSPDVTRQFSYSSANVRVIHPGWEIGTFEVSIEATGLKPNFCYQVKLEGLPEKIWSEGGSDRTNEVLGRAGGWWRIEPQPGPASDREYELNRENPLHVYGGFLMIDFFVTDHEGSARVRVKAENSYLRVRRVAERPRLTGDGSPRRYEVGGSVIELYGESLAGRAEAGRVVLPRGRHNLQISLTEETFGEAPYDKVLASDGQSFWVGF